MSDEAGSTPSRATSPGGLLRQARQAQGLHIAALAAAIKVVPRKLELLESDQFDQLPDATFTRALAQAVCRTLKIDAAPILALLPPPNGHRLERVASGLKTPFNERPGRLEPTEWSGAATPVVVIAALLVIGAVALYLLPAGWLPWPKAIPRVVVPAPASAASATSSAAPGAVGGDTLAAPSAAASVPASEAVPVSTLTPVDNAPPPAAVEPPAALTVAGVLQLRPTEESWVEVLDARGKPLIARLVQPGESVGLNGDMPFKVKIGNANAMQAAFRGLPLNLGPFTRDNMARLELK